MFQGRLLLATLLVCGVGAIATFGCGSILNGSSPTENVVDGAAPPPDSDDAKLIEEEASIGVRTCKHGDRWGAPRLIVAAAGVRDDLATLSEDELTIIFGHLETSQFQLWTATRLLRADRFEDPTPLPFVSAPADVSHPSLSIDGTTLFYTSISRNTIDRATRAKPNLPFTVQGSLSFASDVGEGDGGATIGRFHPNAITTVNPPQLWFSEKAPTTPAGISIHFATLMATGGDPVVGETQPLPELNVPDTINQGTALSRDGLELFFGSERSGGSGRADIWTAVRKSVGEPFSAPTQVTDLATTALEMPSWLSADGCRLYLLSDRATETSVFRLYVSERGPEP